MAKKATKPTKAKPKTQSSKTTPPKANPGAATEKSGSEKRGRPAGSPNLDRVTVQRHPATCPQCGSTQRTVQRIAKVQARGGVLTYGPNAGAEYTHTVWRDTVCECGQALREISHEHRGSEAD